MEVEKIRQERFSFFLETEFEKNQTCLQELIGEARTLSQRASSILGDFRCPDYFRFKTNLMELIELLDTINAELDHFQVEFKTTDEGLGIAMKSAMFLSTTVTSHEFIQDITGGLGRFIQSYKKFVTEAENTSSLSSVNTLAMSLKQLENSFWVFSLLSKY